MLLLVLVLVCGGGALVSSQQLQKQFYELDNAQNYFEEFIKKYDRHYTSHHEKQERFEIFKQNLVKFNELNQRNKYAVFGITKFSDLTTEELNMHMGLITDGSKTTACALQGVVTTKDAPDSYDWRDKQAVTGVKNQGQCGSCWAFSTIGNVEGQHAIKNSELVQLSEQQLVDCDDKSFGCQGGYMSSAFSKLIEQGGSELSDDYTYTAQNGTCHFDSSKKRAKVIGCKAYDVTDQGVLKEILYKTGPLSMTIYAYPLHGYHGGIINEECNGELLNHGVVLVGYGTEYNEPYWIVKNSWGDDFGENGYFRLRRGKGLNTCCMLNDYYLTAVVA